MLNYVECHDYIERAGIFSFQAVQTVAQSDRLGQPVFHLKRRPVDTFEVAITQLLENAEQRPSSAPEVANTAYPLSWKVGPGESVEVGVAAGCDAVLPKFRAIPTV